MFLSAHHTWWTEHIVHHNDMSATKDFITRRRSYFLVTRSTSPLFIPYSLFMVVMQVFRSAYGLLPITPDIQQEWEATIICFYLGLAVLHVLVQRANLRRL